MNLDRNYWAKHLQSNSASKKAKIIKSHLTGAGMSQAVTQVSPMQEQINKIETKILKKRKRSRSRVNIKNRRSVKNKRINKRSRSRKKSQLKTKQRRNKSRNTKKRRTKKR